MKNGKILIGFSAFGFLLSFVCGLFSKSGFGHIFLSALIFALIFAGLGYGVQIVFDKVLDLDTSSPEAAEISSSRPGKGESHLVDLVISEEPIPETENDTQFFVGTNHNMLTENDISSEASVSQETELNSEEKVKFENMQTTGFVPFQLGSENLKTASNSEPEKVNTMVQVNAKKTESVEEAPDDLDMLPDMDDITNHGIKEISSIQEESGDQIDDVSESYASQPSKRNVDASEVTQGKDTELIAKAISTVLAKDNK